MGKTDQDILTAFKWMIPGEGSSCFVATVTDNGKDKETVTVTALDGTEYLNVRKRAAEDGKKGLIVTPVRDSFVVVSRIGVSDTLFIAMYSEIEEVKITLDNHVITLGKDCLSINMSGGKYEIKNDQENLKTLLNDLINEIMKLTVTTGTGPSGTPINIAQFQQIAQRLPNLFK